MTITEKVQAIAVILGCEAVKPGESFVDRLVFDWGGCLYIEESCECRILIHTSFPSGNRNFWGPSPNPHKISVSASKSAEQIAKDIESRLLPEYKAAYLDAVRQMNEYNLKEIAKGVLAKYLADIIGAEVSRNDPVKFYISRTFNPWGLQGHVLGEDVELKITCSPEMAERICREIVKSEYK
jgi:hypothetical protein